MFIPNIIQKHFPFSIFRFVCSLYFKYLWIFSTRQKLSKIFDQICFANSTKQRFWNYLYIRNYYKEKLAIGKTYIRSAERVFALLGCGESIAIAVTPVSQWVNEWVSEWFIVSELEITSPSFVKSLYKPFRGLILKGM